jgi:hypothetical protein
MLTYRKSYGNAPTREEAMATFKAEYEQWQEHDRSLQDDAQRRGASAGSFRGLSRAPWSGR